MKTFITYLYFTFFSLLIINNINCSPDCSSCTIENKECNCGEGLDDCRWIKINADLEKCLNCNEISKGQSQYYSRQYSTDNEPFCHKVGETGYVGAKMIYGTKQLVRDCKELGFYSLGDFCFDTCPDNSNASSDKKVNVLDFIIKN